MGRAEDRGPLLDHLDHPRPGGALVAQASLVNPYRRHTTPLELTGSSVLVLGLGISGQSAALFCAARGAHVVAADEREANTIRGIESLTAAGSRINVRCGAALPDASDFDLVVPSPGVPPARYAASARKTWGDIELTYRALPIPIAAITGTNGKSTTTCLLEAMLLSAGLRARAAGNLGDAALELVGAPLDVAVLEVSSFQLETTEAFRPHVAIILNITPDHLDRHGDMTGYIEAKARILANQCEDDAAVLNLDDPAVAALAGRTRARIFGFSRRTPQHRGVWLDGETAVLRNGEHESRIDLAGIALRGRHNRDNAAMALAAAMALEADLHRAASALLDFAGLPHRSELVAEFGGVRFVNDSKATNPGAAARALEGGAGRVIWIAGGRDKGFDFRPLAGVAKRCARMALWIGESSEALAKAMGDAVPNEACGDLDTAVARAAELAEPGDTVLLAPACASFDQFPNFEARGDAFRAAAHAQETRS